MRYEVARNVYIRFEGALLPFPEDFGEGVVLLSP